VNSFIFQWDSNLKKNQHQKNILD